MVGMTEGQSRRTMSQVRPPVRLLPPSPEGGLVLAGVKAEPFGWPSASPDASCGRDPGATTGSRLMDCRLCLETCVADVLNQHTAGRTYWRVRSRLMLDGL